MTTLKPILKLDFSLASDRTVEINDQIVKADPFLLEGVFYQVTIQPNEPCWRFGFRFSTSLKILYLEDLRHLDQMNPDLYLACGVWNNETKDWENEGRLELGNYHLEAEHIIWRKETYKNQKIVMTLHKTSDKLLHISVAWGKEFKETAINIKEFRFFLFSAWADYKPYRITGSIAGYKEGLLSDEDMFRLKKPSPLIYAPGLSNDHATGNDYLDIGNDVNAFAKLIAAADFVPPLAIALFGKWGSGKSFFMNRLEDRITYLAANDKHRQYCRGIVHVRFNAWAYMDANLWANLVTKIFEGLQHYIDHDSLAKTFTKQIEKELTEQLNSTKESLGILQQEKKSIDSQRQELESKKEEVRQNLQHRIAKVKLSTLKDILKNTDKQFNLQKKISDTLEKNESYKETEAELKKIIPKEYWDDPDKLYEQSKNAITFLKEFFTGGRWVSNILWLLGIILGVIFVPRLINLLLHTINGTNFSLSPATLSLLSVAGIVIQRATATFKRLQPVVASFWHIKEEYRKQRETAIFDFEQREKALMILIEKAKAEIAAIDLQIQQTTAIQASLSYRLNNALSTEALYTFIERRTSSEDYSKHLGIVSVIRKDFEILSDLLSQHRVGAVEEDKKKAFREKFDNPLERIVLYIDDLDRCQEDRVVEVLEAVHLLMAFPLFVVVVGVDPIWIKNSLTKKFKAQFLIPGASEYTRAEMDTFTDPANYLEKIFQIAFHLKTAEQKSIKNMIDQLGGPYDQPLGDNEDASNDSRSQDRMADRDRFAESEQSFADPAGGFDSVKPESLRLSRQEARMLQLFSALIGNNPRAIKRYINIYRVIRAHEDLYVEDTDGSGELLTIMFLLAFSLGNEKNTYLLFMDALTSFQTASPFPESFTLNAFITRTEFNHDFPNLLAILQQKIDDEENNSTLKLITLSTIYKHAWFVNRFNFKLR